MPTWKKILLEGDTIPASDVSAGQFGNGNYTFPGSVAVDTIAEKTANSGVTIDGALIKDGEIAKSAVDGASQDFALTGDISPTQIAANQNDYNPTGLSTASVLRLSADASRDLTGLQGGADGRLVIIHNVGSYNIVIKDESASSTAANRFALSGDLTLGPDESCLLQYDSTSSRWRLVGSSGIGLQTCELSWPVDAIGEDGSGSFGSVSGNDGYRYYQTAAAGAQSKLYWSFTVPQNYVSGGKLFAVWLYPNGNTSTVDFYFGRAVINDGTDIGAIINYNNNLDIAVPGTAGQTKKTTDSTGHTYAAGDRIKAGIIIDPDFADYVRVIGVGYAYIGKTSVP